MLQLIRRREYVSINELAERWLVSTATIRRDIRSLAPFGVERLRGGARAADISTGLTRIPRMVHPGMVVGICAGPDDARLANALTAIDNISIVTNSLRAAEAIWASQNTTSSQASLLLTPGTPNRTGALGGPMCVESLRSFSLDITFASVSGYDSRRGSFTDDAGSVELFRAFQSASTRMGLLLNTENWANRRPVLVGPPASGHLVIADARLTPTQRQELENSGFEVMRDDDVPYAATGQAMSHRSGAAALLR